MQKPNDFEFATRCAYDSLLSYACLHWDGYVPAEHHVLIARTLERVEKGELDRVMIFMPPRHGKSQLASEYFPAWYIGRNPDKQVITGTYSQELADDFGRKVRNQISHDNVYSAVFPGIKIRQDSKAAKRFHVNDRGVYQAIGKDGSATGRGAHLFLIDDPIKNREEADSERIRQKTKDWYRSVAYTRMMPNGAIVVIQTRWHHDDLAGWLLTEHKHENWFVLDLPAIAEKDDPIKRKPGEALWPQSYPLKALNRIKKTLGERDWNALYQQSPSSDAGNILKKHWWRQWPTGKGLPHCVHVIQSYDTAFGKNALETNSYSARTTWGIFKNEQTQQHCMILLEAWHDRVEYPDLRRMAKEQYMEYRPDRVLIEKKASGQSLLQDLRRSSIPVSEYQPDRDKVARAYAVQAMLESGQIYYPDRKWAEEVIEECAQFPAGKHDDWVDTATQAWLWLRNGWWTQHPDDDEPDKPEPKERKAAYA